MGKTGRKMNTEQTRRVAGKWLGDLKAMPGLETLGLSRARFHKIGDPLERAILVGRGRFGEAYLGVFNVEWLATQRKLLSKEVLEILMQPLVIKRVDVEEQGVSRSEQEVEILKRLTMASSSDPDCPIVKAFGYFCSNKGQRLHMVLEYCAGGDLARVMRMEWTLNNLALLLRQMLRSVVVTHSEGLIHRDIKAENFLLSSEGRVVLTDFGLCDSVDNHVALMHRVGTLTYMSPETRSPTHPSGKECDIYSTGVVVYLAATKSIPNVEVAEYTAIKAAHYEACNPREKQEVRQRVDQLLRARSKMDSNFLKATAMQSPKFAALDEWLRELILSMCDPDPQKRVNPQVAIHLLEQQGHTGNRFPDKTLIEWGVWDRIVMTRTQLEELLNKSIFRDSDGGTKQSEAGGAAPMMGAPMRRTFSAMGPGQGGKKTTLGMAPPKPIARGGLQNTQGREMSSEFLGDGQRAEKQEGDAGGFSTVWNFGGFGGGDGDGENGEKKDKNGGPKGNVMGGGLKRHMSAGMVPRTALAPLQEREDDRRNPGLEPIEDPAADDDLQHAKEERKKQLELEKGKTGRLAGCSCGRSDQEPGCAIL